MAGPGDAVVHNNKRQMTESFQLSRTREEVESVVTPSAGKARQPCSTLTADGDSQSPILKLPNEVLCMVFARLDDCASVCLGLTNRLLWTVHLEFSDPKISLYARSDSVFLYQLLGNWMTDSRQFCHWTKGGKFIKAKNEPAGASSSEIYGDSEISKRCGCLGCSPGELAKLAQFKAAVEEAESKQEGSKKAKSIIKIRRKKQSDVHRHSRGGRGRR